MRLHLGGLFLGLALFGLGNSVWAQNTLEVPDLLPANTLAYVEVRHPAALGREVGQLLKGSALEDMPSFMAKFREKQPDSMYWWVEGLGMLGMMLSPEMLNEVGRLQGAGVALTGFSKTHQPEIVGFILSGQSNAPSFFMRTYLTMDEMKVIGTVGNVPLYQRYGIDYRNIEPVAPGAPPPPRVRNPQGPVYANTAGLIVIGSSREAVTEVVSRFQKKNANPALSSLAGVRESAKQREKPGLFIYADVASLLGEVDTMPAQMRGMADVDWKNLKAILKPNAVRSLTAQLNVERGEVSATLQASLDPKQPSPLLELLPTKPAKLEPFAQLPSDSLLAFTVNLSEGEERFTKLLALADTLAKSQRVDDAQLPSKMIAQVEQALKVQLGKQVFGKVEAVTLQVANNKASQQGPPLPAVLVHCSDEAAAKDLTQLLPKLLSMATGEQNEPVKETVEGQQIFSLAAPRGTGIPMVHFGQQGRALAIGLVKSSVTGLLQAQTKKLPANLLANEPLAAALKKHEAAAGVGVVSLGSLLKLSIMLESAHERPIPGRKPGGPAVKPPEGPVAKPSESPFAKELAQTIVGWAPATIALTKQADQLTLEIRDSSFKTVSSKLITQIFEQAIERSAQNVGARFGAVEDVAVPAPVVEEKKPEEKKPEEKKPEEKKPEEKKPEEKKPEEKKPEEKKP